MTAVKQSLSRDFKIAVAVNLLTTIVRPPSTGAFMCGLNMEGGRVDRENFAAAARYHAVHLAQARYRGGLHTSPTPSTIACSTKLPYVQELER